MTDMSCVQYFDTPSLNFPLLPLVQALLGGFGQAHHKIMEIWQLRLTVNDSPALKSC